MWFELIVPVRLAMEQCVEIMKLTTSFLTMLMFLSVHKVLVRLLPALHSTAPASFSRLKLFCVVFVNFYGKFFDQLFITLTFLVNTNFESKSYCELCVVECSKPTQCLSTARVCRHVQCNSTEDDLPTVHYY